MVPRPRIKYALLLSLTACGTSGNSGNENASDGALDAPVAEAGIDVGADVPMDAESGPDAGIDRNPPDGSNDGPSDAPPDGGEAETCTAPLNAFGCEATYPGTLQAACLPHGGALLSLVVSRSSCGPFVAIAYGLPPGFYFCLYDSADGGSLVGAETINDVSLPCPCTGPSPEMCDAASRSSFTTVGGSVPASCADAVYATLHGTGADASMLDCANDGGRD